MKCSKTDLPFRNARTCEICIAWQHIDTCVSQLLVKIRCNRLIRNSSNWWSCSSCCGWLIDAYNRCSTLLSNSNFSSRLTRFPLQQHNTKWHQVLVKHQTDILNTSTYMQVWYFCLILTTKFIGLLFTWTVQVANPGNNNTQSLCYLRCKCASLYSSCWKELHGQDLKDSWRKVTAQQVPHSLELCNLMP